MVNFEPNRVQQEFPHAIFHFRRPLSASWRAFLSKPRPQLTPGMMRDVLESIADPRKRRRIRDNLTGILALVICAVLTGAKSFAEISEWDADTGRLPLTKSRVKILHVATIRRALVVKVNGDVFDAPFGAWIIAQVQPQVIAIDGKQVRGAKNGGGDRVHLMAAAEHATGSFLGHISIGIKTKPNSKVC